MPHQAKLYEILAAYQRNRRQHFTDRDTLEQWQRRMLLRLYKEILPQSPYYREYLGTPLDSWPPVSAPDLVRDFDQINTLGLQHEEVFARGVRADISRDYSWFARDYIPLLSAGSKGRRRAFPISHEERLDRIGTILARLYPDDLPPSLSIACYYRGNNVPCYELTSAALTLHSYDIQDDPAWLLKKLQHQQPHIIIAPASILLALLRELMEGRLELPRCERVYNSGEVMTARDRLALRRQFAVVGDIYQGVEGVLGVTCRASPPSARTPCRWCATASTTSSATRPTPAPAATAPRRCAASKGGWTTSLSCPRQTPSAAAKSTRRPATRHSPASCRGKTITA